MTTKTRRELIDQALDNLGVLVIGQAPSDEDVSKIDGRLDAVLELLAARDIVYVPDAGAPGPPTGGEIELSIFLPLADILAWRCAGAFNLAGEPSLKVLNDQAEEDLLIIGRPARTRQFLKTDTQLRGALRYRRFNFATGQ